MNVKLICLSLLLSGVAHAQTTTFATTGNYNQLMEGPTSQNARLINLFHGDLHYYPNVDLSPNYSTQNQDPFDEVVIINLNKDSYVHWDQPERAIGLPRNTTAVTIQIKLKAQIKRAEWDGTGDPPPAAYCQSDIIAGKASAFPTGKTDLAGFQTFAANYNHVVQSETSYFVPWDQEQRVIRFVQCTVPVSKNANGDPCIGFLFNWAIMNRDTDGSPSSLIGTSRGFVEATVYLSGFYTSDSATTILKGKGTQ